MPTISQIRQEYKNFIENNPALNRAGALQVKAALEQSPLFFHGECIAPTLQIPQLYDEAAAARLRTASKTAYGIFEKVIQEYLSCADYRRLFPFPKKLEELIQATDVCPSLLPLMRMDVFYHADSGKFYFCEVNADGSSGMNEDRVLRDLFALNPAQQYMQEKYTFEGFEFFDTWVRKFLDLYRRWGRGPEKPQVAMVDFLDRAMLHEFEEFVRRFDAVGISCAVADVRDLRYENGRLLLPDGRAVDAIYRRSVTADVLEYWDSVQPFIQAVKDNAVFMAGSFCTQVVHNKWLFYVLHLERTLRFLTEEERAFIQEHIPQTVLFGPGGAEVETVLAEKDKYILKPMDGYGSRGVYAGVEHSAEKWAEIARSVYGQQYICQAYCPQYAEENIDFAWGDGAWHPYINMAGIVVFDGEFAGIYTRVARGGIIVSHRNKRTLPTYLVKEK